MLKFVPVRRSTEALQRLTSEATAAASGIALTDAEFAELNMPSEASAGRGIAPKMMFHEIDVRSWSEKF